MKRSKPKSLKRGYHNDEPQRFSFRRPNSNDRVNGPRGPYSRRQPRAYGSRNPRQGLNGPAGLRKVVLLAIVLVVFIIIVSALGNMFSGSNDDNVIACNNTTIGSNGNGTVVKEGPFGNASSPNKIAIVLGTHPREIGAHEAMYNAINNLSKDLNSCYYVYKIKVTNDTTDFDESRMQGQTLAQEFVVGDIIKNNFTFAIDAHYSDGTWGVERFVFTPLENNTVANNTVTDLVNHFDWLSYYYPYSASSPAYLTGPLDGNGVPAIVFEAYTQDDNNLTYSHDIDLLKFLDSYNFNKPVATATQPTATQTTVIPAETPQAAPTQATATQ